MTIREAIWSQFLPMNADLTGFIYKISMKFSKLLRNNQWTSSIIIKGHVFV
ncbi:hypothetical protein ACQKFG_09855 [Peribacillus sp. NPDC076916]|uniref:hypothetical protein n=1 Tax=Peribacillus TaxID=2675229 RepID=UPI0032E473E4